MFEVVAVNVANQRCQQSRQAESADTLPDLYRSEGFFEDLSSENAAILRLRRSADAAQPAWVGMLAAMLGLRRA